MHVGSALRAGEGAWQRVSAAEVALVRARRSPLVCCAVSTAATPGGGRAACRGICGRRDRSRGRDSPAAGHVAPLGGARHRSGRLHIRKRKAQHRCGGCNVTGSRLLFDVAGPEEVLDEIGGLAEVGGQRVMWGTAGFEAGTELVAAAALAMAAISVENRETRPSESKPWAQSRMCGQIRALS